MGNQCNCWKEYRNQNTEVVVPERETEQMLQPQPDFKEYIQSEAVVSKEEEIAQPFSKNSRNNLCIYKNVSEDLNPPDNQDEDKKKYLRGGKVSQNKTESFVRSPMPSRNASSLSIRKSPQISTELKLMKTKKLEEPYEVSVLLLGSSGVGKTSIIFKIVYNQFDLYHIPSINAEKIEYDIKHNNRMYHVSFIDTCGLAEYKSELDELSLNCDFLVYAVDLTDNSSFTYVKDLIMADQENQGVFKRNHLQRIILGNKSDIAGRSKSLKTLVKEFADNKGIAYHEVSAKNNLNLMKILKECLDFFYDTKVANLDKFT